MALPALPLTDEPSYVSLRVILSSVMPAMPSLLPDIGRRDVEYLVEVAGPNSVKLCF
jgi:hypothetical protein